MIHLLSLASFCFLLAYSDASSAQSAQASSQVPQEQQDREARQKRANELLGKAQSIEIDFVGNHVFSDQSLLEQMKLFPGPDQRERLWLWKGATPWELLQDDLQRVRFYLGTKGYVLAQTGEPQVEGRDGNVKVMIPIQEKARYKIGKLEVMQAKVFLFQELLEMSGLVPGAPIDANVIQDKIYKGLKDAYADRGYIQASIDFSMNFKLAYPLAPEGIVDVTLEIDEGRKFFVEWIDFYGEFSEKVKSNKEALLDCLLLKEGDVYCRQLMNETLNNLKRLGWFEEIREKDVMTRISDGGPLLQIKIQVKEIKPSSQQ
jgi:outer membrane protein assembly factor BamA